MQVVFFSNFLNHHQLPFCLKMQELTNGNFYFVATEKTPKDRLDFGYEDMNEKYPFVVKAYEDDEKAIELARTCDLMMVGGTLKKYTRERMRSHKIMFRCSERIQRDGFNFRVWLSIIKNNTIPELRNTYLLCNGAFTSYDFNMAGAYVGKSYKWGYFPECRIIKDIDDFIGKKKPNKIIWVGRFLKLKHPEKAIEVARRLSEEGIDYTMEMVGDGPERAGIMKLVEKNKLDNKVKFSGALPFDAVRKKMDEASVLLFTSDQQEGWGAVLNEAMSSACITISDSRIGSVPFLIKNGVNGYYYRNDEELFQFTKESLKECEKNNDIKKAAYRTIADVWNADVAARRLIELYERLVRGGAGADFEDGPCSKTKIIKDGWAR